MIDRDTFEHLLPFAYEWAKATEEFTLACGAPLSPRHLAHARLAGVRDCSKIRVLVVDRIPMPENRELAEAARHTGIITDDTRCVGFGMLLLFGLIPGATANCSCIILCISPNANAAAVSNHGSANISATVAIAPTSRSALSKKKRAGWLVRSVPLTRLRRRKRPPLNFLQLNISTVHLNAPTFRTLQFDFGVERLALGVRRWASDVSGFSFPAPQLPSSPLSASVSSDRCLPRHIVAS